MHEITDFQYRYRWLGETPEMLVWWLKGDCPLLNCFAQAFPMPKLPAQAAQAFRPLHEFRTAAQESRIDRELVYLLPRDDRTPGATRAGTLAYFLDENFQSFGGVPNAIKECEQCRWNTCPGLASQSLAGCLGILVAGSLSDLSRQTQALDGQSLPLPMVQWQAQSSVPQWLCQKFDEWFSDRDDRTSAWYRLVSKSSWDSETLLSCTGQITATPQTQAHGELAALASAIETAIAVRLPLQIQHIPRGYADGRDWWIGPHCSRCHFPMTPQQPGCPDCGHDGFAVPVEKRRIMGWSPYWPLEALVGPTRALELESRWQDGAAPDLKS